MITTPTLSEILEKIDKEYDTKTFGTNLKMLRRMHNLTQTDIATITGTTKSTIAHYEQGYTQPPAIILLKLTVIFNITLDKLLLEKPLPNQAKRRKPR